MSVITVSSETASSNSFIGSIGLGSSNASVIWISSSSAAWGGLEENGGIVFRSVLVLPISATFFLASSFFERRRRFSSRLLLSADLRSLERRSGECRVCEDSGEGGGCEVCEDGGEGDDCEVCGDGGEGGDCEVCEDSGEGDDCEVCEDCEDRGEGGKGEYGAIDEGDREDFGDFEPETGGVAGHSFFAHSVSILPPICRPCSAMARICSCLDFSSRVAASVTFRSESLKCESASSALSSASPSSCHFTTRCQQFSHFMARSY